MSEPLSPLSPEVPQKSVLSDKGLAYVRLGRRQAKLYERNLRLLHAVEARNGMRKALVEHHAVHKLRVLHSAAVCECV
jgi:hypothetical protein